jgi:putative heme-binding domain-containing protein
MTSTRLLLTITLLAFAGAALPAQQQVEIPPIPADLPSKNPLTGNPEAIQNGMGQYRARCADCHGMDARGARGPDLTEVWASGRSDDGLFRTLRQGVPGTEMPAVRPDRVTDEDIWRILAYLRTLAVPAPTDPVTGNAQNGERLFRIHCVSCHRADSRGGRFGPDLSRVGASRARAALTRQIRGAVEEFAPGYEPVTLTMPSGRTVHGVKKNEDLFSVQIMDTGERIQGYLREDLKQVTNETRSAMPAFDIDRLSQSDLDDLLAYLATLRGAKTEAPIAGR